MAPDAAATDVATECEAMSSVDDGEIEEFIIAYPCRDDAWISMPLTEAASLSEWA